MATPSLLGTEIVLREGIPGATHQHLLDHLKKYQAASMLMELGKLSSEFGLEERRSVGGYPIQASELAFLALLTIEVCEDTTRKSAARKDVVHAVRLIAGMDETRLEAGGNRAVEEHLLRTAVFQHGRDRLFDALARTWLLYEEIWPCVQEASGFDLRFAFGVVSGTTWPRLVALVFLMASRTSKHKHGVLDTRVHDSPDACKLLLDRGVEPIDVAFFFQRMTAEYAHICNAAQASRERAGRELGRYNPLEVWPLVKPDGPTDGPLVLVPHWPFLLRRITSGIYHDLCAIEFSAEDWSDARQRCRQPFRAAFGHVFEEYLRRLLRGCLANSTVQRGPKFKTRAGVVEGPDAIVAEGDRFVFVEAKQSALRLEVKETGDLDALKENLRDTLTEGVQQLLSFREAVRTSVVPVIPSASSCELLLVVYDHVPLPNTMIRGMIADALSNPEVHDVHICWVADLEFLLCHGQEQTLHALLERKRLNRDWRHLSIHDYCARHLPRPTSSFNIYLREAYEAFSARVLQLPPK